jgi:hypothetical protein
VRTLREDMPAIVASVMRSRNAIVASSVGTLRRFGILDGMREQRLLVTVPEGCGVELSGLGVENMLRQREHVRRNGEVRQIAEVILGLTDLIGVAQRVPGEFVNPRRNGSA